MDEPRQSSSAPKADAAMTRYAEGEDAAFPELYDYLADRLYGYLLRRTGNVAQAEDLLQQTFLQIHRQRGCFIPGAQVSPWAFRMAENLASDLWRKTQRRARHAWRLPSAQTREPARGDEHIEASETASRLELQLRRLPASQRRAFELNRVDGLTLRETAQMCGTTVAAAKQLIHRAKTAMRGVLDLDELDGLA